MNSFDVNSILLIQQLPAHLLPVFKAMSFLGSQGALLCVVIFIMYVIDYKIGIGLIFVLSGSTLLNSVLQTSIRTPRPFEVSREIKSYAYNSVFNGYSMPSLHTQSATVILGKVHQPQAVIQTLMTVLFILLISTSQMYLGQHSLSQVSGGILTGILFLYISNRIVLSNYFKQILELPEKRLTLYIFTFSLIITLCLISNIIIFEDFRFNSYESNFRKLEIGFYAIGLFTGTALGSLKFTRRFTILENVSFLQRFLSFLLAALFSVILLLPIHNTIRLIAHTSIVSSVQFFGTIYFIYLLYVTYGFLLTFIFPVFFHRLKLMKLQFNYLS